VGKAVFFGWDSRLRIDLPVSLGPVEKIIISLSYQYQLSYLLSYGYTWASEKRIPYMPMHAAGASLDIPWKTGSLLVSGHYEGLRYSNTSNTIKLDPHFLLNITLNQKTGENNTLFAALRNTLNQFYDSIYNYPMPGITLTMGIKMLFGGTENP
jgi:vitamin B12 transporter